MPLPDRLAPTAETHSRDQNLTVDEIVPRLSRSPHPYHRHQSELTKDQGYGLVSDAQAACVGHSHHSSSTESGTEADDERGRLIRSLPAPPLKARKGLKGATPVDLTPAVSPLPTPSHSLHDSRNPFFTNRKPTWKLPRESTEEQKRLQAKYIRRRRGEVVRRCTEFLLFCFMAWAVCSHGPSSAILSQWHTTFLLFSVVVVCLYALYPFRLVWQAYRWGVPIVHAARRSFRTPSRFDPGPLIYPVFLPALVSISIAGQDPGPLVASIVLGISAVPPQVVPVSDSAQPWNCLHWFLSLLPLHLSSGQQTGPSVKLLALRSGQVSLSLNENLTWLFPLHQTFTMVLTELTSTSLDISELRLLSIGLINVFIFAKSPQVEILKALMWVGGISIYVMCGALLRWELALARIPKFKFARKAKAGNTILQTLESISSSMFGSIQPATTNSDSDDSSVHGMTFRGKSSLKLHINGTPNVAKTEHPASATTPFAPMALPSPRYLQSGRRRHSTFPVFNDSEVTKRSSVTISQSTSSRQTSFLSLTYQQAVFRKWSYALLIYAIVVAIVLVPVRRYVSLYALDSYDPFGWALGYLFGNWSRFRFWVVSNNLENWITLPPRHYESLPFPEFGDVEFLRQKYVGPANFRLLLCGYCAALLATGIATILRLSSVVEVDTRRKVFHGIMVAILLPTIFIDPCFIALALALILAIFLLLDLFRASQLPPISKPLTTFLAPYVDGRDHRGPVIVSPIFLLIGCAIPLWLSLAAMSRTGMEPWRGWEVKTRDVSMVSGVICVGMGDAAASLIGRRYGRHKWYWAGGKSLEGSVAFMLAVTVGLVASSLWLRIGGWDTYKNSSVVSAVPKALCAGLGASLLESTLTAANDNVVVPIGLWLLVRGLDV